MSTEPLHPILAAAGRGQLPRWAKVDAEREEHVRRVSDLMSTWAERTGLSERDRLRWAAAGLLHDALKEETPERLRATVPDGLRDLPDPILHGPGAAARLRAEGVRDEEVLEAVAWHTLGHRCLARLGLALYAADFLEPGRDLRNAWRAGLRERVPAELEAVVEEILGARLLHLVEQGRPVRRETIGLWNRFTGGESWARASEV